MLDDGYKSGNFRGRLCPWQILPLGMSSAVVAVVVDVFTLRMSCLCPPDIPMYRTDRSSR